MVCYEEGKRDGWAWPETGGGGKRIWVDGEIHVSNAPHDMGEAAERGGDLEFEAGKTLT